MEIVDENGDLFGVVNVIDAAVLLLVLFVVVAGVALTLDSGDGEPTVESTHVTLDLGQQPVYIASEITAGDTYTAGTNNRLTLTDVYLTPQGDTARVVARARIQASSIGDGLSYANAPLRLGRRLDVATNRYRITGQIRSVGRNETLGRSQTTVVIRDTMAAPDARAVASGDEIRLAGTTVATVDDVAVYATDDPNRRAVFVQATLRTYSQQGDQWFAGGPVRRGQAVRLSDESYTLDGRIERVGGGLDRARAEVVVEDVVSAETALQLREGDVATVAGHETARVESATTYATQNPDRKRVVVGLSLRTLGYEERSRFGTMPVQRGADVTFDASEYTLSGTVGRVGTTEPRGSVTTRTVTLRIGSVREETADTIRPGMTERSGNATTARVIGVDVEPSLIITTGDDGSVNVVPHPFNRDVSLTTRLRVRETTGGVQFKSRPLRQGREVTLDLGTNIVRATVVRVGP